MKYRFRDVIDSVEFDDLMKLKNDLDAGGIHIRKLVENKIKEHEKQHETQCSVCSNNLDPNNTENYTLIFGPEDFRKKASFCALDCLEYFIRNLKELRKDKLPENSKSLQT